jgi:hypothetical protein
MEMSVKSATGLGNSACDPQGTLGADFQGAIGRNPEAVISALNQQYATSGDALPVLRAAVNLYKDTKSSEYSTFAQGLFNDITSPDSLASKDDKKQAQGIVSGLKSKSA